MERITVRLDQLQLDTENPRFPGEQDNQREAIRSMINNQGDRIVTLAKHILDNGTNPANLLIIIPSEENEREYVVLDGNRRLSAIKLLMNPSLADKLISISSMNRLRKLSETYSEKPIKELECVLFENRNEADKWIELIHRGQADGAGLVQWDGQVSARYDERKGVSNAGLRVIDYVYQFGNISDTTRHVIENGEFYITNLVRLLNTPGVRRNLGIITSKGGVKTDFPRQQIIKGLTIVVEDIGAGNLSVSSIKSREQRLAYIGSFNVEDLPSEQYRLNEFYDLGTEPEDNNFSTKPSETSSSDGTTKSSSGNPPSDQPFTDPKGHKPMNQADTKEGTTHSAPSNRPILNTRNTLIPRTTVITIQQIRINGIYRELKKLKLDTCPNACAVLLRVFLELSLDEFISLKLQETWNEQRRNRATLRDKFSVVIQYFEEKAIMNEAELKPIKRQADGQTMLAASIPTLHGYVHSRYFNPIPNELKIAWDEIQTFMVKLWECCKV